MQQKSAPADGSSTGAGTERPWGDVGAWGGRPACSLTRNGLTDSGSAALCRGARPLAFRASRPVHLLAKSCENLTPPGLHRFAAVAKQMARSPGAALRRPHRTELGGGSFRDWRSCHAPSRCCGMRGCCRLRRGADARGGNTARYQGPLPVDRLPGGHRAAGHHLDRLAAVAELQSAARAARSHGHRRALRMDRDPARWRPAGCRRHGRDK